MQARTGHPTGRMVDGQTGAGNQRSGCFTSGGAHWRHRIGLASRRLFRMDAPAALSAVDHERNEVQLFDDGPGHLKGIEIGLAQASRQPIQCRNHLHPAVQEMKTAAGPRMPRIVKIIEAEMIGILVKQIHLKSVRYGRIQSGSGAQWARVRGWKCGKGRSLGCGRLCAPGARDSIRPWAYPRGAPGSFGR